MQTGFLTTSIFKAALNTFTSILFVVAGTILTPSLSARDSAPAIGTQTFTETSSHFQVDLPSGWTVVPAKNPDDILRLTATSPDRKRGLFFFAFAANDKVDLDRLAAFDHRLGIDLGPQATEKKYQGRGWLGKLFGARSLGAIEREYGPNSKRARALGFFQADGTYGYAILALTVSDDLSFAKTVCSTFQSNIPIATNLSNWWQGFKILRWVAVILGCLLIAVLLYFLGWSGSLIRRGIEVKQFLRVSASTAASQGLSLTPAWLKLKRQSTIWVIVPIFGWSGVYLLLYAVLPFDYFRWTPLALVIPTLGFFGVLIGPSDSADDYFPEVPI